MSQEFFQSIDQLTDRPPTLFAIDNNTSFSAQPLKNTIRIY